MAVALVFIQWQRELGVITLHNVQLLAEQLPFYLSKHPDQPTIRVVCQLSGPKTPLNYASEEEFRLKIDVSALDLRINDTERVVPLTSDMLTSTLRPDIWRQLSVAENSLDPRQVKFVIMRARSDEDIPDLPESVEGETTIALIEWRKEVPVVVPFVGKPAPGYRYTKRLTPETVILRGKREALQTIRQVTTVEELNIERTKTDFVTEAKLPLFEPGLNVELVQPATSEIQVDVKFFGLRGEGEE